MLTLPTMFESSLKSTHNVMALVNTLAIPTDDNCIKRCQMTYHGQIEHDRYLYEHMNLFA